MNISEHIKQLFYVHDGSFINKNGDRVGTINIANGPSIGGNKWIAQVMPYGGTFPEHEEAMVVAKLFHASPDLLQAAMMVQKYFRTLDHGFNQELTDCSNAINKAIDKAILPATRYDHDCEACTFLGQYNQYDLYYCHSEPTVIARYANEGAAYTSGLSSDHHALIEAKKRASEKGFI